MIFLYFTEYSGNILNESVRMISGFIRFHNSNSSVGCKMENKRSDSLKYILAKKVRNSGNSIIHSWISMLLTGICGTTACAAALKLDGGRGCVNRKLLVWI